MRMRQPLTLAISTLTLAAVFSTSAVAQGTANQPDERERQEVLENQPGQSADSAHAESGRDSHSSATNCADLLAEENRAANNAEQDEVDRRSASVGQVNQSSETSQSGGASGATANAGVTGNPQGSRDTLNHGNATLSLEECRNQQNAIPNGEPNGSGQGPN